MPLLRLADLVENNSTCCPTYIYPLKLNIHKKSYLPCWVLQYHIGSSVLYHRLFHLWVFDHSFTFVVMSSSTYVAFILCLHSLHGRLLLQPPPVVGIFSPASVGCCVVFILAFTGWCNVFFLLYYELSPSLLHQLLLSFCVDDSLLCHRLLCHIVVFLLCLFCCLPPKAAATASLIFSPCCYSYYSTFLFAASLFSLSTGVVLISSCCHCVVFLSVFAFVSSLVASSPPLLHRLLSIIMVKSLSFYPCLVLVWEMMTGACTLITLLESDDYVIRKICYTLAISFNGIRLRI